jgi:phage gpG-like protein
MSLTADLTELRRLRADLQKVGDRVKDKHALLDAAGKYMVNTEVPTVFRESGPGWKDVRRGGKPLRDTGALASSVEYSVEGDTLTVGSKLPQAGLMNAGGTVKATGKWLTVPGPDLTAGEARRFNLPSFQNTFVKPTKDGSGFTVYQKTRLGAIRIVANLVSSVTIPQRKFLDFGERALDGISRRWTQLVMEGK